MKENAGYDALSTIDEGSRSSTQVGGWSDELDSGTRSSRRGRAWKQFSGWQYVLLNTLLLVLILGLLVERRWRHLDTGRYELGGDLAGFAPRFSQQVVTFRPDPRFAPENASAFWDEETQQAWLSIVPRGLGYVRVRNPMQYDNLPTPIHDYPNHTVYTTSVTHQLHCLYTILDAYSVLHVRHDPALVEMPFHINHCFEYLRQAIMCAGDVALEGAATTFPDDPVTGDRGGSDGWDAKHICKDYSQIYAYLEKEAVNSYKWISS